MTSECLRIMCEQLDVHWRQLYEIDVIEQAESVIREQHQNALLKQLTEALSDVDTAKDRLAEVRESCGQSAAVMAEEHLCAVRRRAENLLDQINRQRDACALVQDTHKANRAHLLHVIQALQLAISRRRAEEDNDGVLPWPPVV